MAETILPHCPKCNAELYKVYEEEKGKLIDFAWAHKNPQGCKPIWYPLNAFKLSGNRYVKS